MDAMQKSNGKWDCCRHCEPPCPAEGHGSECPTCRRAAVKPRRASGLDGVIDWGD